MEAAQLQRTPNGRFTKDSAKVAGAKGGATPRKKPTAMKLAKQFGLGRLIERWKVDDEIEKFIVESEQWFVQTCVELTRDVGGGQISPGVTSILRSASYARAFSNFLYDCATRQNFAWETLPGHGIEGAAPKRISPRMDLLGMASRLADSSRQNYMAAFEIAAREATARRAAQKNEPYDLGRILAADKETP